MSPVVDVRAGRHEVEDRGGGPPLLWLGSCFGEAPWLPFHDALVAAGWRVVAPHAPSLQPGGVLEQIETIDDYVLHVIDVCSALGLDAVAVVGASFGGWVAAELAASHPRRVRALVLVDAMGLRVDDAPVAEVFAPSLAGLAKLLLHDPRGLDVAALPVFDRSAEPMDSLVRLLVGQEAMARFGWNPYLHDPRLPSRVTRYGGPALVVWGDDDRVLAEGHAHTWADLLGARLELVERAGHLPAIEQPDRVAAIVDAFLRAGNERVPA